MRRWRRLSNRSLRMTILFVGILLLFTLYLASWSYHLETRLEQFSQHSDLEQAKEKLKEDSQIRQIHVIEINADIITDLDAKKLAGPRPTTSRTTITKNKLAQPLQTPINGLTTPIVIDKGLENDTEESRFFEQETYEIPHKIHQMFKTNMVPNVYTSEVKSWIRNQPTWEYWFWTDEDIRNLILDYYPDFLPVYDNYKNDLQRADSGRYIILYHFGGLYVDLDYQSLKAIDDYLINRTMIVAPEPPEQSLLLYNRPIIVTNSIMAAAPEHEFLSRVIAALPAASRRFNNRKSNRTSNLTIILYTTGPNFLQGVYENYVKENKTSDYQEVYLAPYEVLVPTTDVSQQGFFREICTSNSINSSLSAAKLEACQKLRRNKFQFVITDTSRAYAKHHWQHWGYYNKNVLMKMFKHSKIQAILDGVNIHRYVYKGR